MLSDKVSPDALKKILEFKNAGLPVFCSNNKPISCAGLGENPNAAAKIADKLWGGADFENFANANLVPSCEGDFEYITRREKTMYFSSRVKAAKKLFSTQRGLRSFGMQSTAPGAHQINGSCSKTEEPRLICPFPNTVLFL